MEPDDTDELPLAADAPDPNAYALTLPPGANRDQAFVAASCMRQLGLTPAQTQMMLDRIAPTMQAATRKADAERRQAWADETFAHPEIGGARLRETIHYANTALRKLGTPALREELERNGLANNSAVLETFSQMGRALSEDRFVGGRPVPPGKGTAAEALYGVERDH